jgi:hypothetical protein
MKIILAREHLVALELAQRDSRVPTSSERQEITRIINFWSKAYNDPNVNDVNLKNPLSERDVFLLCSSCCPEIIELTFQLLALQGEFSVNPESETSLLLGVWWYCPQIFRLLLAEKGWNIRTDLTDTLRNIRFRVRYYRRPKKVQRHKGYRDKGTLPDRQRVLRQSCLSEYYAEELRYLIERDKNLRDTIELLYGLIS